MTIKIKIQLQMSKKMFRINMSLLASVPMNNCSVLLHGKDWDSPILLLYCRLFFSNQPEEPSICCHNLLTIFSGTQSQRAGMNICWHITCTSFLISVYCHTFLLLQKIQRTKNRLLFKTRFNYGHLFCFRNN